ncbi:MAG: aminotransferase class IV, partial [Anaerolineales bacterium]|nr:aminotransferase class IV [Anaerolineales bacterium]
EIFSALFPCASITGAPKVSTMRIIAELEGTPRRIYTGTIGHIAPNRRATFNVAIRTALIDCENQIAEYGVGGGVVWDSTSRDEYAEALLKARVLKETTPDFSLLETMLWTPQDGFFLRDKHVARLCDSADYFDFSISREQVEGFLNQLASQLTSSQRVRLLLDKNGNLNAEATAFEPPKEYPSMKIRLAKEPVHSENKFLFHKTTYRKVYNSARKDFPEYDDILLYNERNELTEFTIGNLILELDEKFYTPPITCGLLAGTFRSHLLETGQVEERVVRVDELKDCTNVFLINSVRKWQKVLL